VPSQPPIGFVSYKSRPTIPIDSFTQEDLIRSKVIFTHAGNKIKKKIRLKSRTIIPLSQTI